MSGDQRPVLLSADNPNPDSISSAGDRGSPSTTRGGRSGSPPGDGRTKATEPVDAVPIAPDSLSALETIAQEHGLTVSQLVDKLIANSTLEPGRSGAGTQPESRPARLSVNINKDTNEALQELARERGVTMTEAVRRLIGYGAIVYRSSRDGHDVLLRRDGKLERLMLLD